MATLAMEVSRASMNVASVTVMAITQGFARGRHVSWNELELAVDARSDPHFRFSHLLGTSGTAPGLFLPRIHRNGAVTRLPEAAMP